MTIEFIKLFLKSIQYEKINISPYYLIFTIPVIVFMILIPKLFTSLSYDSFDIKLMHKRSHSPIQITKTIFIFLVLYIMFTGFTFLNAYIMVKAPIIFVIFLFLSIVFFVLSVLYSLFYVFARLKKIQIFVNKKQLLHSIFYIIIFIFTFISSVIFAVSLLLPFYITSISEISQQNNLESILFLLFFSLMQVLLLVVNKPIEKKEYILISILENRLPIEFKLELDYSISENTSVLFNKAKKIKAVKRNNGEKYIIEIYKLKN